MDRFSPDFSNSLEVLAKDALGMHPYTIRRINDDRYRRRPMIATRPATVHDAKRAHLLVRGIDSNWNPVVYQINGLDMKPTPTPKFGLVVK
jgi:hypothetical protein